MTEAETRQRLCADCEHPEDYHRLADGCGIPQCGCLEFRLDADLHRHLDTGAMIDELFAVVAADGSKASTCATLLKVRYASEVDAQAAQIQQLQEERVIAVGSAKLEIARLEEEHARLTARLRNLEVAYHNFQTLPSKRPSGFRYVGEQDIIQTNIPELLPLAEAIEAVIAALPDPPPGPLARRA